MNYAEIKEKIDEISKAISSGNYTISYEEPNFFDCQTAPDGSKFYVAYDMDDARSANYFGSCTIYIADIEVTNELEWGEWSSGYFDEIEEEYEPEEGEPDFEDIKEEITDMICDIDDFITGPLDDLDSQAKAYATMIGEDYINYYWYEDGDKPMNVDDFTPINEAITNEEDILTYNNKTYYIVDRDDNCLIVVSEDSQPSCQGRYDTLKLVLSDGNIIREEPYGKDYDSSNSELY